MEALFYILSLQGRRIDYKPQSDNPLENLTIYMGGFEIVDNRQRETASLLSRGFQDIGSQQVSTQQNTQGGESSVISDEQRPLGSSEPILRIPNYYVEATLIGHFVLADGTRISEFIKRVSFETQPSF